VFVEDEVPVRVLRLDRDTNLNTLWVEAGGYLSRAIKTIARYLTESLNLTLREIEDHLHYCPGVEVAPEVVLV
jgi:hypothetical protein